VISQHPINIDIRIILRMKLIRWALIINGAANVFSTIVDSQSPAPICKGGLDG
jgi:hypothetical protein